MEKGEGERKRGEEGEGREENPLHYKFLATPLDTRIVYHKLASMSCTPDTQEASQ